MNGEQPHPHQRQTRSRRISPEKKRTCVKTSEIDNEAGRKSDYRVVGYPSVIRVSEERRKLRGV